jgi:hypothetical protein
MTTTFDAFFVTDEVIALMTGLPMDRAPMLINRATGAAVVCGPTALSGIPGMCSSFGYSSAWPGKRPCRQDNAWTGRLPIEPEAAEIGISIVLGEVVRNATVRRRPKPEPAPKPPAAAPPKRARRARKARA